VADAAALMTPSDALTGWAAALLHGVADVDGLDRAMRPLPVVVCSPARGQHRVRPGLRPTRRAVHDHEVERVDGIRVTTLARAAYDLALDAADEQEALVALDTCVSTVRGGSRTTVDNVRRVLDEHAKTRGIAQTRAALALASARSASPAESRTRHVAVRRAGLRDALVNPPVFAPDGALAGVVDLLVPSVGLVVESDGAGHRQERTHAADNSREERLERLGLFVVRVSALDHRRPDVLVTRLRQGFETARRRALPQRWTLETPPWWEAWPPARRWG
jgi:very-short-patch-repair endonuclease